MIPARRLRGSNEMWVTMQDFAQVTHMPNIAAAWKLYVDKIKDSAGYVGIGFFKPGVNDVISAIVKENGMKPDDTCVCERLEDFPKFLESVYIHLGDATRVTLA